MSSKPFNQFSFMAKINAKLGNSVIVTDYQAIDNVFNGDTLRTVCCVRVTDVKTMKNRFCVYIGQTRQPVRGRTVSECKMHWRYYAAKAGLRSMNPKPLPNTHAGTSRISL